MPWRCSIRGLCSLVNILVKWVQHEQMVRAPISSNRGENWYAAHVCRSNKQGHMAESISMHVIDRDTYVPVQSLKHIRYLVPAFVRHGPKKKVSVPLPFVALGCFLGAMVRGDQIGGRG